MNRDYYAGMTEGRIQERERIIKLFEENYDKWLAREDTFPDTSILEAARIARLGTIKFFLELIQGETND